MYSSHRYWLFHTLGIWHTQTFCSQHSTLSCQVRQLVTNNLQKKKKIQFIPQQFYFYSWLVSLIKDITRMNHIVPDVRREGIRKQQPELSVDIRLILTFAILEFAGI